MYFTILLISNALAKINNACQTKAQVSGGYYRSPPVLQIYVKLANLSCINPFYSDEHFAIETVISSDIYEIRLVQRYLCTYQWHSVSESFPYVPLKSQRTTPLLHYLTTVICALCVSSMTALVIFPFDWPWHNVISVAAVWKGLLCSIWAMSIALTRLQLCF